MVKTWIFDIFNYPHDPRPEMFDPAKCAELYDWHLESWLRADEQAFDGIFFSEHHFTAYNVSPSPNLLVATVARLTKRIRLGVMANIVPFHDPRRLAEEAAMLDYLTGGRLEVGLGRGVDEQEFLRQGIPMEDTRPRFEEGMELIHTAWHNPVFSHHGRFWNYDDVTIWPRPLQQPNPPVWITALSPATVEWAGRKGYKMGNTFLPTADTKDMLDRYRAAAAEAGNSTSADQVAVMRNVLIADTDEEAREIAEPALSHLFSLFKEHAIFDDLDNVPAGYEYYSSFFRPFVSGPISWQDLIDAGIICVGSPETVRDQLVEQARTMHCGNIIFWGSFGTLTREQTLRSYELYDKEVIPALKSLTLD
ncbi:LLM class flavin-dependent oxidoreductase [Pseudonocardia sp. KRD-184]|uniref:LLM class flavin-dependent oxidoreductase n=1 Tax=Pseudonocardia oceani TaxID=2792013 RepID=A0ABS6UEC2_9PSEU|nr:LLM class flavin-dependent oxidoreductase [Pseudonocardia oceani]MBW0088000.1 LLM class flavin-dependent oxidoreductase [Pseudonocardia oceani]MBW0094505.1 LLM class flavin-dependent oxidoreductase [Pseudonocardia oceani]MBW0111470.1 LLM class flavin-dependent oxidoreductase [Pseudonocardia oceani]MBW0120466.1 LLM class flavin-dependent oxidoreductase [Pseudonocardia oceani]MBW0130576.1 LLM class flavin-dependent oxidoreductase [Pseudonocardia oceani]